MSAETQSWYFRPAETRDLEALMVIEEATFPEDAWTAELMHQELSNPWCKYFIAVPESDARGIDGYIGLALPRGEQADIQTITVREPLRGKGLGRALLQFGLSQAQLHGAQEVFLEVREDNVAAQNLYTSAGFEVIGVRKGYYHGVDALSMRLRLSPPQTGPANA